MGMLAVPYLNLSIKKEKWLIENIVIIIILFFMSEFLIPAFRVTRPLQLTQAVDQLVQRTQGIVVFYNFYDWLIGNPVNEAW